MNAWKNWIGTKMVSIRSKNLRSPSSAGLESMRRKMLFRPTA